MYRRSDNLIFMILAAFSIVLALGALILIVVYHFFISELMYRDAAVILFLLSVSLRWQLYMFKTEILEKKVANLMQSRDRLEMATIVMGNLSFIFYTALFWIAIIIIAIAFFPILQTTQLFLN